MRRLLIPTLLACLGAAAPLAAQSPDRPTDRKAQKPSDVPQRPADRPADRAGQKPGDKDVRALVRELETHEVRMRRLQRLRALFTDHGETDKVAKIDSLIERENRRNGDALGAHRAQLGDDTVAQVQRRLKARRDRAGEGKASDRRAGGTGSDKPGDRKKTDKAGDRRPSDKPAGKKSDKPGEARKGDGR